MTKVPNPGMPLASVSAFLEAHGFGAEAKGLDDDPGADKFKRRAKKGKALKILRAERLLERFISECWPDGATPTGKRKMNWYDLGYLKWVERFGSESLGPDVDDDVDEPEEQFSDAEEFQILEKELQNYLAKNPGLLEAGMTLWKAADGQSPVEFQVDESGRRIDILGKDKEGIPVVIELKASRGHERVIGQALYYRECIKEKLNAPKVRTFIIAREISDEVRIASRAVPDVELFEYKLSMTVTRI